MNDLESIREPWTISSAMMAVYFISGITCLLGLSVMLGWVTHNNALIQIHPNFAPMQFNTAFGFVLCGMALALFESRFYKVVSLLSVGLLLLSSVTLLQYLTKSNYGIDELFIEHHITHNVSHPGRMAPNTALNFILAGLSLLLISYRTRYLSWSLLGIIISGLGIIAASGYLTGIETSYGWGKYTQMALHTSVGFIIFGMGLVIAGIHVSDLNKIANQKKLQLILLTSLIVVVLSLWQTLSSWKMQRIQDDVKAHLQTFESAMSVKFKLQTQALERLLERQILQLNVSELEWNNDALNYISDFKDIELLMLLEKNTNVSKILPTSLNFLIKPLSEFIIKNEGFLSKNLTASTSSIIYLDAFNEPLLNRKLLVLSKPKNENDLSYVLLTVLDIDKTLGQVIDKNFHDDFFIQLRERKSGSIIFGDHVNLTNTNLLKSQNAEYYDLSIVTNLIPKTKFLNERESNLPNVVLFFGLTLSITIMLAYREYFDARNTAKELNIEIKRRKFAENELTESNTKYRLLAEQDTLTGLANRYLFEQDFTNLLKRSERQQNKFALIVLDLDGFKEINDNYGHDAGDKLLVTAAKRIEESLRAGDLASRVGGDEFMILVSDVTDIDGLEILAKRILDAIAETYVLDDGIKAKVSASIGVAIYPNNAETKESLFKLADSAMYRSKRLGKNQIQFA